MTKPISSRLWLNDIDKHINMDITSKFYYFFVKFLLMKILDKVFFL